MPTREDMLRDHTHKDLSEDVERRVFYTLTDKEKMQAHRTAKAVTLVIALLQKKNLLSEDELDDLLLDCAM